MGLAQIRQSYRLHYFLARIFRTAVCAIKRESFHRRLRNSIASTYDGGPEGIISQAGEWLTGSRPGTNRPPRDSRAVTYSSDDWPMRATGVTRASRMEPRSDGYEETSSELDDDVPDSDWSAMPFAITNLAVIIAALAS